VGESRRSAAVGKIRTALVAALDSPSGWQRDLVQQVLVQTKLTAAQNRVSLYQSLGGDSLIANAPLCPVTYVSNGGNATLATQCPPASAAAR